MLKPSDLRGFLWALLLAVAVGGFLVWRVTGRAPQPAPPKLAPIASAPRAAGDCASPAWRGAAERNEASLYTLAWAPFGPAETGWATYAPLVAHEVGTACGPDTPAFARAYAAWQASQTLTADGVFKPADFERLRATLMLRRPFVRANAGGACPSPPDAAALATARPDEGYGGKIVQLRAGALAAYRRMVAAARTQGLAARPPLMTLLSGYRGPAEEAARCADGGCDTLSRAHCSAHRTGLALDLYLDPAPGHDPTSSDAENRRHMAQTAEYRWLVANAGAYGFLPYPYEPWHWEWTGEAP